MQCWSLRIMHEHISIIMAAGDGAAEAAQAAPFSSATFAYVNFELPQALTRLHMFRQCTLTQYIVNGLPSPDKIPAAMIMSISEKSFRCIYPIASYTRIAIVVSDGTDLHKHVFTS